MHAQMGRGMYALPSRPSKIVANARIVPSKTLNNLEITRHTDKQPTAGVMSAPKPVFNGNKHRHTQYMRANSSPPQTQYSAQHEEIVRYLSDAWMRVNQDLNRQRKDGPIIYTEKNHNPKLDDFQAFDLHQFWGDRMLQSVTGSTS